MHRTAGGPREKRESRRAVWPCFVGWFSQPPVTRAVRRHCERNIFVNNVCEEIIDLSPEEQSRRVISSRILNAPVGDVFDAYANPQKIVHWWGLSGFTLITESIDLKGGGHWRFVFKGPNGTEYKNHLVFLTIEPPYRFVVEHLSGPKYRGTVIFEDMGDRTHVTMYWPLENAEVYAQLRQSIIDGN